MTDPDELRSPSDWTRYLGELLSEAEAASGSDDPDRITAAREALQRFERQSPPFANALDRIALSASLDLAIADSALRLKHLKERREEYTHVRQLLAGVPHARASVAATEKPVASPRRHRARS